MATDNRMKAILAAIQNGIVAYSQGQKTTQSAKEKLIGAYIENSLKEKMMGNLMQRYSAQGAPAEGTELSISSSGPSIKFIPKSDQELKKLQLMKAKREEVETTPEGRKNLIEQTMKESTEYEKRLRKQGYEISGWSPTGKALIKRNPEFKSRKQSEMDFEVARNKLRVTAAAFKAMQQHAGGTGATPALKTLIARTGPGRLMAMNPYVSAYEGQLVEAAASLAKLASPSARVGQEIIEQFKKTLPGVLSIANPGEFESQIRFSLHNAFAMALARSETEYTSEIKAKVDKMVEDIINTPPMNLEELQSFNKQTSQGQSSLKRQRRRKSDGTYEYRYVPTRR